MAISGHRDYGKRLPVLKSSTMLSGREWSAVPTGPNTLTEAGGGDRPEPLGLASLCPHPLPLVFFHICSAHQSPPPGPSAQPCLPPPPEEAASLPTALLKLTAFPGLLHASPTGCWIFLLGGLTPPHTLHTSPCSPPLRISTESGLISIWDAYSCLSSSLPPARTYTITKFYIFLPHSFSPSEIILSIPSISEPHGAQI